MRLRKAGFGIHIKQCADHLKELVDVIYNIAYPILQLISSTKRSLIRQHSDEINNKMKAAIFLSAFAILLAGVNAIATNENQHAVRALVSTLIFIERVNSMNANPYLV